MKVYFTQQEVSSNIEAIAVAGKKLLDNNRIYDDFIKACTDREVNYPTGLLLPSNHAVAMPHGESKYVKEDSISIVRTPTPVIFKRMDDPTQNVSCQLVFNLALASGERHIEILRHLMVLLQDQDFINNCLTYDNDKIVDYVTQQLNIE